MFCKSIALSASIFALTLTSVQAQNLRDDLHSQSKAGHQRIGYGATYNVLETLYADPDNAENVILFYTNRSQDADQRVNGDAHNGWNREHLWPQSRGTRREPMKSDLHHLKPTDATVNADRGSLNFDEGGGPQGEALDTFLDGDSFEPRDEVKGDVARALFYMDIRYEGTGGEPNLVLVDRSAPGRGTQIGDLCTLLKWHSSDPPDASEIARNDRIELIQGNRNPFIDDAGLAADVYGVMCGAAQPAGGLQPIAPVASQDTLRLASWNIANFWHVDGEHLRPRRDGSPGLQRTGDDYDNIREVIATLGADIIGLQEIGAPEGADLLFPSSEWQIVFSMRLADDLAVDPNQLSDVTKRDIYTVLAIRRDAARVVSTERIELDILHEDGFPAREGTAALIDINGTRLWVASIHLKSGCFTENDLTQRDDCRTLAKQIPILEDWIDEKSASGAMVALLGDFNRQIDRGSDVVRQDLDDGTPVDLFKVPHRQYLVCSAFSAVPRTSIDYVIVNEALWEFVSVPATLSLPN
nr:endonuclease [Ruegeria sp. HKCCD8929]